jgi:hypothetical protein
MAFLNYQTLSRKQRREAKRYAKHLLATVPAATTLDEIASLRGALATAFMKPKNVIGVLVYGDDHGNWWADIVLRKGKRVFQGGSPERNPMRSREHALECAKHLIAQVKAMREHPIVQVARDGGLDPEATELFRVEHEKFGCRWAMLDERQISAGEKGFSEFIDQACGPLADKIEVARRTVLELAPRFADHPYFLTRTDESEASKRRLNVLFCAVAFLSANGIVNLNDQDEEIESGSIVPSLFGDFDQVFATQNPEGSWRDLHAV